MISIAFKLKSIQLRQRNGAAAQLASANPFALQMQQFQQMQQMQPWAPHWLAKHMRLRIYDYIS